MLSVDFFHREKASLQHEIEEKEDMIRQRNGEIQVHSHGFFYVNCLMHLTISSHPTTLNFYYTWVMPYCWLRVLKERV